MLIRKVDALTKAIEAESKKIKREAAAREKEAISAKLDDTRKIRSTSSSRRLVKHPLIFIFLKFLLFSVAFPNILDGLNCSRVNKAP